MFLLMTQKSRALLYFLVALKAKPAEADSANYANMDKGSYHPPIVQGTAVLEGARV